MVDITSVLGIDRKNSLPYRKNTRILGKGINFICIYINMPVKMSPVNPETQITAIFGHRVKKFAHMYNQKRFRFIWVMDDPADEFYL